MKKLSYILNGILAVAVIVLYILFFTQKSNSNGTERVSSDSIASQLPIAYVNVDSLLNSYNYAKDLNEALIRKQENARVQLNENAKKLQQEMAEFQKKVQNNAFLSQERAQSEQNRLMRREQELRELDQRLSANIMREQQQMNEQLRDVIYTYLKEYNKDKKYQIIFSNTMNDNILISEKPYDITNEVIVNLNKRYSPQVKK